MAKRIIITVTNDLVTDQRVSRVTQTLLTAGYQVLLVGRSLPGSAPIIRSYPTHRFKLWFNKGPLFYACYNLRLFFYLLNQKFDAIQANDLDTLPAGFLAAKIKGKPCIYDSHEYFTEVPELIHRKFQQKIWMLIEQMLLPRIKYAYTVSPSIADAYLEKYGVPFEVVRNLPNLQPMHDIKKEPLLIYQGAINLGRGIELMVRCMAYLPEYKLFIAGSGDVETEVKNLVIALNLENRVQFLGRVAPELLKSITAKAQLGLSWEEDRGLNYRFALPNKLFDYIQARVPVLVSDLPEMHKIVSQYQVGAIIEDRDPQMLAQQIENILGNTTLLEIWNEKCEIAAVALNWENEKDILLAIFNKALA